MADIFRNPLQVNRRDFPPVLACRTCAVVVGSLLTTTLAVVAAALPFQNASAFPSQSHDPVARHAQVADTSRGTPKTLTADTLRPAQNPTVGQVDLRRYLSDTSADSPVALLGVATPAPFLPLLHQAPARFTWQPADTSKGLAKPLFADSTTPNFNPAQFLVERVRFSPDTSQDSPVTLLSAPLVAPLFNPIQLAPDRLRPVVDTTKGTPKPLTADAQAPVSNKPQFLVERTRYSQDTSADSPTALLLAPVPDPISNEILLAPDRLRPVYDTSKGTPKTLTRDAQAPVFNPAPTLLDRVRPVANTSAGTPAALLPVVFVQPPFRAWPQPVIQWAQFLPDTSRGSSSVLLSALPATPWGATQPPTGHGAPLNQRPPALSVGRRPSAFSRTR